MNALAVLPLVFVPAPAQETGPRTVAIETGFELAGHRALDLDGDGDAELVLVARDGRVRALRPLADEPQRLLGELTLPAPEHTLLELATWDGRPYLVAETPAGVLAYPLDEDGVAAAEARTWIPRGRFTLRLDGPTFAHVVQDVNHDGLSDVLVPTLGGIEFWQASLEPGQPPTFRKAATVEVEVESSEQHGCDTLTDTLECEITIPDLETADVNGDGRPDLVVGQDARRAWHLQREDASFPLEPDVTLDLSIFQDTSPAPTNGFGSTASDDGPASLQSRDLDGDGIPDHVIVHRRKVWVFLGGPAGPQFQEPSEVLIAAEDVSACLLQQLDADELPDLLFVKLQIPTIATLLRGLFGEWDVSVRVLAYHNAGAGSFERDPSLTNDLALRLPGIIGLMRHPERLTNRFEELGRRFRAGARGDLDGDGKEDVLLVTADAKGLELWRGRADPASDAGAERWLRTVLFDERDAVYDVDRVLATLGGLADREAARLTGGRPPDRTLPLRDPERYELAGVQCVDFDGDGAREVLLVWHGREGACEGAVDVLCFPRTR